MEKFTPPITPKELEHQAEKIIQIMKEAITKHVPRKSKRFYSPWPITADILKLIKEKRKTRREYMQTRNPSTKTAYNNLTTEVKEKIKEQKNLTWIKACNRLEHTDPATFWKTFWRLGKLNPNTETQTLIYNNKTLATDAEKCNCFHEILEKIHQPPEPVQMHTHQDEEIVQLQTDPIFKPFTETTLEYENNDTITMGEITTIFKKLKNTSPGHDKIPNQLLKQLE